MDGTEVIRNQILSGGISKQPAHLRLPSQVTTATNVCCDISCGMYKRPGTQWIAYVANMRIVIGSATATLAVGNTITSGGATGVVIAKDASSAFYTILVTAGTFTAGSTITYQTSQTATITYRQALYTAGMELRIFPLVLGVDEGYLMILGGSQIPRIFPVLAGSTEATVSYTSTYEAAVATYMAYGTPSASQYRVCAAAQYHLIANCNVPLATLWQTTEIATDHVADNAPSATRMPHRLRRTGTSPLNFIYEPFVAITGPPAWPKWSTRASRGTAATNPIPSPFLSTQNISDIAIHKDRLQISAGPFLLHSQINNFADFWIETPGSVVDSDPVLVTVPSEITPVARAVPFRQVTVIFTANRKQFELSTSDTFSPGKVAITPTTDYDFINAQPPSFATSIIFASRRRETGVIRQYVYDDLQVSSVAIELTGHVDSLISPNIVRIATHASSNMIFVLTTDDPTTIYVGTQQKVAANRVQTAWTKWTFSHLTRVCDMCVLNGALYIIGEVSSGLGYVIEGVLLGTTMTIEDGTIITGSGSASAMGETSEVSEIA